MELTAVIKVILVVVLVGCVVVDWVLVRTVVSSVVSVGCVVADWMLVRKVVSSVVSVGCVVADWTLVRNVVLFRCAADPNTWVSMMMMMMDRHAATICRGKRLARGIVPVV